jgi:hypothetical protein
VREEQLENVALPIFSIVDGSFTELKDLQPLKSPLARLVQPSGMVTDFSFSQLKKEL